MIDRQGRYEHAGIWYKADCVTPEGSDRAVYFLSPEPGQCPSAAAMRLALTCYMNERAGHDMAKAMADETSP